uniref:Reverse transcriptase domain-containing protein n=1 Tax=Strongyloides stercoralis TaxID=6248 RepID=A0A0K0EG14_STRER
MAGTTYSFSIAVPIFDHYQQERTFRQYVRKLENAFNLDEVTNNEKKIAILKARTAPHTNALLSEEAPGQTFQAYVEACRVLFLDALANQNTLNRYLHFKLDYDNFENSIRSFIRIAESAIRDNVPAQRKNSVRTKLMEMLIRDEDLWSCNYDGLIKRVATINHVPNTIMFDTGAYYSIVSKKIASKMKLKTNTVPHNIITGGSYIPYYEIEEPITCKVDGQTVVIKDDCYVSSTNLVGFNMILENTHLKKLRAIIDTVEHTVIYKKPTLTLQFAPMPNDDTKENELKRKLKEKYPKLQPKDEYDCGDTMGTAPPQNFTLNSKRDLQKMKFYHTKPTSDEDYVISKMLQYNIIERGQAFEILPKYLLMKRDGQGKPKTYKDEEGVERQKLRFILDARRINERTRLMNYPAPTLFNIFSRMTRFNYASKLDLHCGFWQIQLPP